MKRLLPGLILIFLCTGVLAAPGNAQTATRNDELYIGVRRIALIAGQTPPPRVSPISLSELHAVLLRIDPDRLAPPFAREYSVLLERTAPPDTEAPASGTIGLGITLEGYLHTASEPDEWLYWYPDRKPLLSIPFRVQPIPGLAVEADLDWRKNYPFYPGYETTYQTVNVDPASNVFGDLRETDVQFPFFAQISAAGDRWSLLAGRSRLAWGSGATGSLLLSDHVEYHDFLSASLTGRIAGYRALYLDLEPWVSASSTDPDRVYLAHRIELHPFPWLDLTANEALIFHGKALELRYLNPLVILHSWFIPNYGNSMINLELAVRPVSGLEVWAHLAVDQVQSAAEEDRAYADSEPEALAYLAGAEYVTPVFGRSQSQLLSGSWLTAGTEWVFLDPWMYIGRDIMGGFTSRRRVQAENVIPAGAKVLVEKSLGYPSGPDYYGITGYGRLDLGGIHVVETEFGFYANGENAVGRSLPPIDEDDAGRVTPSGDAPEFLAHARIHIDSTVVQTSVAGIPVGLTAGFTLDALRALNNDFAAGALLWDLQFSPYLSVRTVFGR